MLIYDAENPSNQVKIRQSLKTSPSDVVQIFFVYTFSEKAGMSSKLLSYTNDLEYTKYP